MPRARMLISFDVERHGGWKWQILERRIICTLDELRTENPEPNPNVNTNREPGSGSVNYLIP